MQAQQLLLHLLKRGQMDSQLPMVWPDSVDMQLQAVSDSAGAESALMNPFSTMGVPQPAPEMQQEAQHWEVLLPIVVFVAGLAGVRRLLRGMR